jgi:hydroxymethylglutaryl-CoA reductase
MGLSMTSRIPGFGKLSPRERLEYLRKRGDLSEEELKLLSSSGALELSLADRMVENVVGFMPIPMGMAMGMIVNGREYLVPMATEQKSVISMVTLGAELTRLDGGFRAKTSSSTMIGQIQLTKIRNFKSAKQRILTNKKPILDKANTQSRTRKAIDVETRTIETAAGPMFIVELIIDVKDSMGANVVDSMCEEAAPLIKSLTGGSVNVRVVSSLATRRLACVETIVGKRVLEKTPIINQIVDASAFAESDPFRAATHNKGIMNAVSAVLLATANDTRAVEAGAHAFAAMSGQYRPLSVWQKNDDGDLVGKLIMPMAVGVVGGAISTHPVAKIVLKIMRVKTAKELGELAAAAGLAYNLAALHTLLNVDKRSHPLEKGQGPRQK